jgi:hypothetical protein
MPAYAECMAYSARIRGNIAPPVRPLRGPALGHKAGAVGRNLVNFVGESSRGHLPESERRKMLVIAWTLMKKKEVFDPSCIE